MTENGKKLEITGPEIKFPDIMNAIKGQQELIDIKKMINDFKVPDPEDIWTLQPKKAKKEAKKKEEAPAKGAEKPAAGGKKEGGDAKKPAEKKK